MSWMHKEVYAKGSMLETSVLSQMNRRIRDTDRREIHCGQMPMHGTKRKIRLETIYIMLRCL